MIMSERDTLARIEQLVRIESPSGDVPGSEATAALLGAWWAEAGAEVRTVRTATGLNLVAELDGVGRPLLLVGHSDTVWPRGAIDGDVAWRRDGARLHGPGIYDMKSGLVVMLAAVEAVRHRRHRAVRVVVVCDEEIGSPTTQELLRSCAQGVSAAIGFESPHPDGALKVGRRGSTRVRLAVRGRASHAALDPGAGISAIDELVDQLVAVRALVEEASHGSEVLCNVGSISGGARANVVAEHAEAELGLRFIDAESETQVLGALHVLAPVRPGAILECEQLSHRPAWLPSEADRALLAEIARAGAGVGQVVTGRPAAGAGDANLLGRLGVPTVDGFGPRGGGAHAASEHILISSVAERVALLVALLQDADAQYPTRM